MVSIRLQQACWKYAGIIKRIESSPCEMEWGQISDLEYERVKWHNAVMSAMMDEGMPYADRSEATDIALQIAMGMYP